MTDTITFGPGPVARQVVAEGDGDTLVINQGPATVFFGGSNAIRATDAGGIVAITANSYFAVNGESDLYACVASGDTANLEIISGGLNFFLPVTSLTIPYGATGQRIVINPPAFPGSIVGYNPAGLIEFVISPNGYLLYDATGGAFQHLFVAIQNFAGSDSFGNPFAKGIQVGPQTGPQVLIAGGNPATVSFPINDAAITSQPVLFGFESNPGPAQFAGLALQGPGINVAGHRDTVIVGMNSPSKNGSSSANGEIDFYNDLGVGTIMAVWDNNGFAIRRCPQITATDPSVVATSTNPAIAETWHDMRPLQNAFVGTTAGYLPPQFRKVADGTIQFAGYVKTPPTTGNYNNVPFTTIPSAWCPPNVSPGRPQWCVTDAPAAGATPVKIVVKETGDIVFAGLPASQAQVIIGIWGSYPLGNTGQILS
jgi:hypothetical protein